MYTPYMTVHLVISLPKIPYIHRIFMVLANPKCTLLLQCKAQNILSFVVQDIKRSEGKGKPAVRHTLAALPFLHINSQNQHTRQTQDTFSHSTKGWFCSQRSARTSQSSRNGARAKIDTRSGCLRAQLASIMYCTCAAHTCTRTHTHIHTQTQTHNCRPHL